MSFDTLLVDTCTTRRYTEGAQDTYGNPTRTWTDYLEDEPCRLASAGGREVQMEAEAVIADYKLFLDDVDITEQDTVVVSGTTYRVLLVERKQNHLTGGHHKEAMLQVVR
jgi:hypothetical protein